MSYQGISYQIRDNVALVGFGYQQEKSMTVLDEITLRELERLVGQLEEEQKKLKGVIFFTHKERCFIAGADIKMIGTMNTKEQAVEGAGIGQNIFNRIEDLSCPTIACVHGVCLGGGLEMALSCKDILVSDDKSTQLGLPEVKLGLLPGFGGTYRLPSKVGLPAALDMILTGRSLKAKKCKQKGLAVGVYPKERLVEQAFIRLNKKNIHGKKRSILENNIIARKIILKKARDSVLKKTRGLYQAPLKILDHFNASQGKRRKQYLNSEAVSFAELCISTQSSNLRNLFFMMEGMKKYPNKETPKGKTLRRGAVLGAGTMGGGIAWLMAEGNMFPLMKDLSSKGLELGLAQASSNFAGAVKRKRMTPDQFENAMRSISPQLDYSGFSVIDVVVEAVLEDMSVKKKVLAEVEKEVNSECILTTNTSSLSVSEMASVLDRPENFAGLHFFNPVNLMPLVEIVTHDKVSESTVRALYDWCLKVRKSPLIVADSPGFLVNRILMPYLSEAGHLLKDGASPMAIEEASLSFGMPMGPLRLLDEIGLDVGLKVAKVLHQSLGDRVEPCDVMETLTNQGLLGKKAGKGFYLHSKNKKIEPVINPDLEKLIGSKRIKIKEEDIQHRLILPMINEAALALEEKIVAGPAQVDLGLIFGIGFPPFHGGILRYADTLGCCKIVELLNRMEQNSGSLRYRPCQFLSTLAQENKTFY